MPNGNETSIRAAAAVVTTYGSRPPFKGEQGRQLTIHGLGHKRAPPLQSSDEKSRKTGREGKEKEKEKEREKEKKKEKEEKPK